MTVLLVVRSHFVQSAALFHASADGPGLEIAIIKALFGVKSCEVRQQTLPAQNPYKFCILLGALKEQKWFPRLLCPAIVPGGELILGHQEDLCCVLVAGG